MSSKFQSIKIENFHLKFIYRISYKIAKRQAPEKRICPIENCGYAIEIKMSDLSRVFRADDIFILWQISAGYSNVPHAT